MTVARIREQAVFRRGAMYVAPGYVAFPAAGARSNGAESTDGRGGGAEMQRSDFAAACLSITSVSCVRTSQQAALFGRRAVAVRGPVSVRHGAVGWPLPI